jgi:hypothetical protein
MVADIQASGRKNTTGALQPPEIHGTQASKRIGIRRRLSGEGATILLGLPGCEFSGADAE